MSVRNIRRMLNTASALCLAGLVWVVLWALKEIEEPAPVALRVPPVPTTPETTAPRVTTEQLAAVWSRNLRGQPPPAKPDKPKPVVVKAPPPVNPRVELLATVIDAQRPMAIIADARGRTDLKSVGETLNLIPAGLRVESIRPDAVTLSLRGRSIRVRLRGASEDDLLEPPGMRGP